MEYIFQIILVVVCVAVIAIIINATKVEDKNTVKMSFRETMDLTGLPIITFKQDDKKYNFILDTGAYTSLIDSRILSSIKHQPLEGNAVGYGIDGKEHTMEMVGIVLSYKDKEYSEVFRVLDMSSSFGRFKEDYGVTVHGLLSSSFFERYKYI